jgi:hypothetical protein
MSDAMSNPITEMLAGMMVEHGSVHGDLLNVEKHAEAVTPAFMELVEALESQTFAPRGHHRNCSKLTSNSFNPVKCSCGQESARAILAKYKVQKDV